MTEAQPSRKPDILVMPGKAFFITSLLYLLLGCGAFFSTYVFLLWTLAGLGLAFIAIADIVLLLCVTNRLKCKRELPSSLAQGEAAEVKLYISRSESGSLLPTKIMLYDLFPASMKTKTFPAKLDRTLIKETGSIVFEYALSPVDRGPWLFSGVELLLTSPLLLWRMRVRHYVQSSGRTYPNFKKLSEGQELRGLLEKGEVREIRRRGQGLEFESLRDYQVGDSIRAIDWRASSRSRHVDGRPKLIVKNYQEEQEQQVLFIIDSGYRMPDFHFDSALNAVLLLSHTVLKHGDSVAAASYGASERWIPPRKGISSLSTLMNGLYDLHSEPVPSSIFSALENALARLRRRTFIIIVSNFNAEDGESLSWILPQIERRHLVLMVSFRESEAEAIATTPCPPEGRSAEQTVETAAAFSYLAARRRMYRKWEHSGLLVLETTPEHISAALINSYLEVKRSGRL